MAVVLVTGGSSGIGRATVIRLASAGHRVFAASRHPERAPLPDGVVPVVLDLADAESCAHSVAAVAEQAGRLDVLVNNAGRVMVAPLEETADDEIRQIFEVNFFGPMRLVRAALPALRAQGGGRIVNVTSANDVFPAAFGGWYSASKAAFMSASIVLGAEVQAFGVHVTVVAPGLYRTEMADLLSTFTVAAGSPYAWVFAAATANEVDGLRDAKDPDEVAAAIEDVIGSDAPPARVLVGDDAVELDALARSMSGDGFARYLRDMVAEGGDAAVDS